MIYAGWDVGSDGAAAFILPDGKLRFARVKTDFEWCLTLLRGLPKDSLIAVEEVHAVYGSSATATFSFGRESGRILGILQALELEFIMVPPQEWQKTVCNMPERPYNRGKSPSERTKINREHKKALKIESCRAAHEAFPELDTKYDGVCDSVNIARYCKYYHEVKYATDTKGKKDS